MQVIIIDVFGVGGVKRKIKRKSLPNLGGFDF